jgi:hypothetical protein
MPVKHQPNYEICNYGIVGIEDFRLRNLPRMRPKPPALNLDNAPIADKLHFLIPT